MLPGLEPPSDRRRSLSRCPSCGSGLIQVIDSPRGRRTTDRPTLDDTLRLVGVAMLDRYCPECEHRDSVAASALMAAVSYRRETANLIALQALADSVALATPLPPVAYIEAEIQHSPA
jgi:hypothetical protein